MKPEFSVFFQLKIQRSTLIGLDNDFKYLDATRAPVAVSVSSTKSSVSSLPNGRGLSSTCSVRSFIGGVLSGVQVMLSLLGSITQTKLSSSE
jgi:hypothetical protein